jgi:hypothetical protein
MPTQGIRTLQQKTRAIQSAATTYRHAAGDALAAKFTPPLHPETGEPLVPDWETLQLFIAAKLEEERARLTAASEAHDRELHDDPRKREERDEAFRTAYESLVRVRRALEIAVGKSKAYALLGVRGRTPERPQTLLFRMRSAVHGLREVNRRPDVHDFPGLELDWEALADGLEKDALALDAVLSREGWDRRSADLALIKKDRVQASVNDTYVGFAKMLEGMYIACGQRGLAERLRPTASPKKPQEEAETAETAREDQETRPAAVAASPEVGRAANDDAADRDEAAKTDVSASVPRSRAQRRLRRKRRRRPVSSGIGTKTTAARPGEGGRHPSAVERRAPEAESPAGASGKPSRARVELEARDGGAGGSGGTADGFWRKVAAFWGSGPTTSAGSGGGAGEGAIPART